MSALGFFDQLHPSLGDFLNLSLNERKVKWVEHFYQNGDWVTDWLLSNYLFFLFFYLNWNYDEKINRTLKSEISFFDFTNHDINNFSLKKFFFVAR